MRADGPESFALKDEGWWP